MSKGLGKMQRLIVAELEKPGGYRRGKYGEPPFVMEGIHDLREIVRSLALANGKAYAGYICGQNFVEGAWQTSFSRAIRELRKRGLLDIIRSETNKKQVRFVRLKNWVPSPRTEDTIKDELSAADYIERNLRFSVLARNGETRETLATVYANLSERAKAMVSARPA
jgi:hypothetical protein